MNPTEIVINYKNYRGERSLRRILPIATRWGSTEHHPQEQWLMEAWDVDKGAERTFAMASIERFAFPGFPAEAAAESERKAKAEWEARQR